MVKFELEPRLHESWIGHFDLLNEKNFTRIAENVGLKDFDIEFKDGRAETITLNGEKVSVESLKRDGRFYDNLRNRMSDVERIKFDTEVKQAAGKNVYRTVEQIEVSKKVSEKAANLEKVRQLYPELNVKGSESQSKFSEALQTLAGKTLKYGFLAGMTSLALYELGEATKGCYLVNVSSGEKIGNRLSASTNKSDCSCANPSYAAKCETYCGSRKSPTPGQYTDPETNTTTYYYPPSCNMDCACLQKSTDDKPKYQTPENNAQFEVVEGGVFQTFSRLLASAGYQVQRFVDDAMDIVDATAKGLSGLLGKWWVILIIVAVGLVIILVPTLVTQLPKAKAKKALQGGRVRLKYHPYF